MYMYIHQCCIHVVLRVGAMIMWHCIVSCYLVLSDKWKERVCGSQKSAESPVQSERSAEKAKRWGGFTGRKRCGRGSFLWWSSSAKWRIERIRNVSCRPLLEKLLLKDWIFFYCKSICYLNTACWFLTYFFSLICTCRCNVVWIQGCMYTGHYFRGYSYIPYIKVFFFKLLFICTNFIISYIS